MTRILAVALLPVATLLAGCASFSPDGGMSAVAGRVGAETRLDVVKVADDSQDAVAKDHAHALLRRGLTADRAVQIAFLRNKGLQSAYNDLGISEARYVEDSLPPNPSASILSVRGFMMLDIERRLAVDLLSLATLPARQEIAETRWRLARQTAISDTLRLAAEVRRQYWKAVAARAQVGHLTQARATVEATAELAHKLGETGAMPKLDQAREFAFYTELSAQLARARTQEKVEKERLTRLMGLWGEDTGFAVPASLPRLPRRLQPYRDLESTALAKRVDIAMARTDLERTAKSLGLTQATRFVNALSLSGAENTSWATKVDPSGATTSERSRLRGFEAAFEIPIFDFGQARGREAEEIYMRAVNRLVEKGVNARSEVREAYTAYRGSFDVARLYMSRILPLRKTIQDESLLRYNGMLTDLFVLLQDARARVQSNVAAIDAQRDFFIAETNLNAAMLGAGLGGADAAPSTVAANAAD
ncbi:MAG TPA: TolC family protein [Beijerinckiaceae bacterium]|nr:TolC family protein [Rhodoblastus sp.]MCO5089356.1 TolC family protein [Methylobacteriaceae bacterium]HPG01956.1 TolC family protein [Rhodoblastus sp.]HRY01618.1 TolC family protein [Beijerinckiaceae bacterium]